MGTRTRNRRAVRVIHVLRKPLSAPSVAANILEHGCGALHIDAVRIQTNWDQESSVRRGHTGKPTRSDGYTGFCGEGSMHAEPHHEGRWPTNIILDAPLCGDLDAQSGVSSSPSEVTRGGQRGMKFGMGRQEKASAPGDSGGASRYFFKVGGKP